MRGALGSTACDLRAGGRRTDVCGVEWSVVRGYSDTRVEEKGQRQGKPGQLD